MLPRTSPPPPQKMGSKTKILFLQLFPFTPVGISFQEGSFLPDTQLPQLACCLQEDESPVLAVQGCNTANITINFDDIGWHHILAPKKVILIISHFIIMFFQLRNKTLKKDKCRGLWWIFRLIIRPSVAASYKHIRHYLLIIEILWGKIL